MLYIYIDIVHTNIPYLEHLGNLKIIKTCRTVSAEISLCHTFLKTDAAAFGEAHAKLQQTILPTGGCLGSLWRLYYPVMWGLYKNILRIHIEQQVYSGHLTSTVDSSEILQIR